MDLDEMFTCELCGKEINPEYAEEIYDGYICEECSLKLSPFMQELDIAEIEDLEEQISLREENQEKLESFRPTRSFYLPGMTEKIFLDDVSKTFLITDGFNLRQENPDIIPLNQVLDASVEVSDDREEIGDHLYNYTYDLQFRIELEHPYLTEITFALCPEPLSFESSEKSFMGFGGFDPEEEPSYRQSVDFGQDLSDALLDMEEEVNHKYDLKRGEFQLGESSCQEDKEENDVPAEEGQVAVCPWCGCRTHVGSDFRCEHCGGNL